METHISTLWQWTGRLHRLAKVVFQRLVLVVALSVATLPAAGAANYALEFDGTTNGRVQAATSLFSNVFNNFTIELWANPTGFRAPTTQTNADISDINQRFAVFPDHGDSYGPSHACAGLSIGTNGISVFEHAINYLPSVLVYTNNLSGWTHVALVYVNRQARLYVNGTLVRTNLTSTKSVHPSASLGGSIHAPGYGPFQGQLDEVRIWDAPLSEAQIQANMNRSLTGTEAGLVVYYRCDEGAGTLLTDTAPADPVNDGTLVNGTAWVLSGVQPFSPFAGTLPASATGAITNTLNGRFNPAGTNTSAWFEWGPTTNYGNRTPTRAIGSGTGNTNLSEVLPGVITGITYHFRAGASNSFGIAFGSNQSFRVPRTLRVVRAIGVCNFLQLTIVFDRPVDESTSTDTFNYTVTGTGKLIVSAAVRNADNLSVTLTLDPGTPLIQDTLYTVTVSAVQDLEDNEVAYNTEATFRSCLYNDGFAKQELYFGIGGVNIADLTGNAAYPNSPSQTRLVSGLSANNGDEFDNHGTRISGWIIPPISGDYVFYLASDDAGDFSLSTDDSPGNLQLVATEPVWAARRHYIGESHGGRRLATPSPSGGPQANITGNINLAASARYYFEARMKEGTGGDNLDVAWKVPGGSQPVNGGAPIPGVFLKSLINPANASINITRQPANQTFIPALPPTPTSTAFHLEATASVNGVPNQPISIQWQRREPGGSTFHDVPGATLSNYSFSPVLADNGACFRALLNLQNPSAAATSSEACLTVQIALSITRSVGEVVLSWPASGLEFRLQTANTLPASAWTTVPVTPIVSGGIYRSTNSLSGVQRFYRLINP